MTLRSIAIWLSFQLVWVVCAVTAASGRSGIGVVAPFAFTAIVIATADRPKDASIVALASGLLGCIMESALAAVGILQFAAPWPVQWLAPFWLVSLWIAFGTTMPLMSTLLGKHPLVRASLLGAVAGPFAYFAGARLGALMILGSHLSSALILSLVWAITLPVLAALQRHFDYHSDPRLALRH